MPEKLLFTSVIWQGVEEARRQGKIITLECSPLVNPGLPRALVVFVTGEREVTAIKKLLQTLAHQTGYEINNGKRVPYIPNEREK